MRKLAWFLVIIFIAGGIVLWLNPEAQTRVLSLFPQQTKWGNSYRATQLARSLLGDPLVEYAYCREFFTPSHLGAVLRVSIKEAFYQIPEPERFKVVEKWMERFKENYSGGKLDFIVTDSQKLVIVALGKSDARETTVQLLPMEKSVNGQ